MKPAFLPPVLFLLSACASIPNYGRPLEQWERNRINDAWAEIVKMPSDMLASCDYPVKEFG